MNMFIIFILIILLSSCNYPDIDTVPKFNLKKSIIDSCNLLEINDENSNTVGVVDPSESQPIISFLKKV